MDISECIQTFLRHCMIVLGICCLQSWGADIAVAAVMPKTAGFKCEGVLHYYDEASGLEGEALKAKLHKIVAGHQSISYAQVAFKCFYAYVDCLF